jgi:hypothetical protein
MRKVRQIDFDLVGIDATGNQRVVDTYQCDVFDPVGTASDEIFSASNIPGPGERALRGNPGLASVGGDAQNFSPDNVPTATQPRGSTPDE